MLNWNISKPKSKSSVWYERHKEEVSQKRKEKYASDAEYRQRRLEASRKYHRGERTPATPPNAPFLMVEAAKRVGIGYSTLRGWCRHKLFPEPIRYKRGLWFTEHQLSLLIKLKDFFRKHRMTEGKIKMQLLGEVCASICGDWH